MCVHRNCLIKAIKSPSIMSHARKMGGRARQRRHQRRKSVQEIEIFLRAKLRWWIRLFAPIFHLKSLQNSCFARLPAGIPALLSLHITRERSTATTGAQQQNLHGILKFFFVTRRRHSFVRMLNACAGGVMKRCCALVKSVGNRKNLILKALNVFLHFQSDERARERGWDGWDVEELSSTFSSLKWYFPYAKSPNV